MLIKKIKIFRWKQTCWRIYQSIFLYWLYLYRYFNVFIFLF